MRHFDSSKHTTNDVVRQCVIPLSAKRKCCLATLMMRGVSVRPQALVTHNWGNLFADLVAAIVADALDDDDEFAIASDLLAGDIDKLKSYLGKQGTLYNTYWVCAFSVNLHSCICAANPNSDRDPVSGKLHPVCNCGMEKVLHGDGALDERGRSIHCEVNKFTDMMKLLATTNWNFVQLIATDKVLSLFSRIWCVAEIVEAHDTGIAQRMKLHSAHLLNEYEQTLECMKVEHMHASHPADALEILATVPDKDAFNDHLQELVFDTIVLDWKVFRHQTEAEETGQCSSERRSGRSSTAA